MAIMDAKLSFMDAQSLVLATAATAVGNTVDTGPAVDWNGTAIKPDIGRGEPIYVHARIGTAVTSASKSVGVLAVFLQEAGTNTPASFSNLVNMNLKGASTMTHSLLTGGKLVYSGVMPPVSKRYLRVKATNTGTPITVGTIDVWMDSASLPKTME